MSSRHRTKMGEIALSIQPGPFGTQLHSSDYSEAGTPIVMPKDMIDGHISHSKLERVSEDHVRRLARHQVRPGNLMVARKGDVRKCVYITEAENGWLTGSDCLKVSLDESKCVPKFIYYQLRSPYIGKRLETISIGATMPSINTGLLSSIEIIMPPLEEQQRIADTLSRYDSLIENNQKQIKLLEEAAQRLYKKWFVDLHFPGHETTTIVDGVPEGWKRQKVKDLSCMLRRGISPTYDDDGKYVVISQKCIRTSIMDISEARRQSKEYLSEMGLQDSDTVICSTGTGTLGRVGQVFGNYKDTTCDSHVTLVRAKPDVGKQLLYSAIKNQQAYLMGMGRGSTNQQELYRTVIEELDITIPTDDISQQYEMTAQAIHDMISLLVRAVGDLSEARAMLLPKLMNGEIEV